MRSTSTSTIYSIKLQHQFEKYYRKTTSRKTGIGRGAGLKRMIGLDMMITIGQIISGGTIIDVMIIDAMIDMMMLERKKNQHCSTS